MKERLDYIVVRDFTYRTGIFTGRIELNYKKGKKLNLRPDSNFTRKCELEGYIERLI